MTIKIDNTTKTMNSTVAIQPKKANVFKAFWKKITDVVQRIFGKKQAESDKEFLKSTHIAAKLFENNRNAAPNMRTSIIKPLNIDQTSSDTEVEEDDEVEEIEKDPVTFDKSLEDFRDVVFNMFDKMLDIGFQVKMDPSVSTFKTYQGKMAVALKDAKDFIEPSSLEWTNHIHEVCGKFFSMFDDEKQGHLLMPHSMQKILVKWLVDLTPGEKLQKLIGDEREERIKKILADPVWTKFKLNPQDPAGKFLLDPRMMANLKQVVGLFVDGRIQDLLKLAKGNDEFLKINFEVFAVLVKQKFCHKAEELADGLNHENLSDRLKNALREELGIVHEVWSGRLCEIIEKMVLRDLFENMAKHGNDHLIFVAEAEKLKLPFKSFKGVHPVIQGTKDEKDYYKEKIRELVNFFFPEAGHQDQSKFLDKGIDGFVPLAIESSKVLVPTPVKAAWQFFQKYLEVLGPEENAKTVLSNDPIVNFVSQSARNYAAYFLGKLVKEQIDNYTEPDNLKQLLSESVLPSCIENLQKAMMKMPMKKHKEEFVEPLKLLVADNKDKQAKEDLYKVFTKYLKDIGIESNADGWKDELKHHLVDEVLKEFLAFYEKQDEDDVTVALLDSFLTGIKCENPKTIWGDLVKTFLFDFGNIKSSLLDPTGIAKKKFLEKLPEINKDINNALEPYVKDHKQLFETITGAMTPKINAWGEVFRKALLPAEPLDAQARLQAKVKMLAELDERVKMISQLFYDLAAFNAGKVGPWNEVSFVFTDKAKTIHGLIMKVFAVLDKPEVSRSLLFNCLDTTIASAQAAVKKVTEELEAEMQLEKDSEEVVVTPKSVSSI